MPLFREGISADSLSLASHFLRMISYGSDSVFATGTGFIYEYEDYYYLITNGHNITRVNPETNDRVTESIAFPVKIQTKVRYLLNDFDQEGKAHITTYMIDVYLYKDDDYQIPNWYVHPKHKYSVDVVAIPMTAKEDVPANYKIYPINKYDFQEQFYLQASDDVFVIGYPFSLKGGKETPIWKRGTIATEPGIDLDDLPKFLVDTATRQGMSGSPVIFQRIGYHSFGTNGKVTNEDLFGTIKAFIGVYSGRIGVENNDSDNNFKTQLGVVWKKSVIEEIIQAKVLGDLDFQNI